MVQMIARRTRPPLVYAGKKLAEGEAFNVTAGHARLLLALGKANLADVENENAPDKPARAPPPATVTPKRKRGRPRKVRAETPAGGDVPAEVPAPPAPNDPPAQDEQTQGASPEGVNAGTLRVPTLADDPPDMSHDESTDESRPARPQRYRRRDLTADD